MADLGDLLARLLLDGSQWSAGMKQAESEAAAGSAQIEGSLGGISESLGKMGEALAGLAIAEGLKTFAEDAIHASDEMGKFRAAMTALKGSGEETTAFLEHIHELAATSPFAFPELAGAAQKMVQLGTSMEQASATMTAITQMGTALKMTGDQVGGIANAMAKLGAGADPMRVMKTLVSESVPAWQMLAEQLGTNMTDAQAKVKSGALSSDEVIKALTASMGTYADTADKWGGTWKGAMKGFQTEAHAAMAAIGDDIKGALNDLAAPAIHAMTEGLKDLTSWWKNLSPPVKDAILAFGGAIGVIAGVGGAIATLSVAITAIGAPLVGTVLAIAAVVAALVALGVWVNEHWPGISAILTNTWNALVELWGATWNEIVATVEAIWETFSGAVASVWDGIVTVVSTVWNTVSGLWLGIWNGIFDAIAFVWNAFKTELSVFDAILDYLLPFWEPIKAAFLAVWEEIVGTITGAWAKIKGVFDSATGSDSFLGKVGATFGLVKKAVGDLGDEMGKAVPKAGELGGATKTLTAHLADNDDQLKKNNKTHGEHADKLKASKDATALLWAESSILNGEMKKLEATVAANRLEADRMAASGKTLADKVTAIKIPVTDAAAGIEGLGKAAEKTMGQIAAMSTIVGAGETAMRNLGVTSSAEYKKIETDAADAYHSVTANPLATEWDKANASAKLLQAQIDALSASTGNHGAELDNLKGKLATTTAAIDAMKTSTTDAYHAMNLQTSADLAAITKADEDRWKAAKTLAEDPNTGSPYLIRQAHEAELQMLKDYQQFGGDLSAEQESRLTKLETELGKHQDVQKEAWKAFDKDVKKDFGDAFNSMEDMLITGDGSFHDIMTKLWQGLAKDALDLFLAPLKTAIEDFLATTIKSLLGSGGFGGVSTALGDIGDKLKGLFSGGGGAAESVPGLPNVMPSPGAPPTSGVGSAVSAGMSGVMGIVTAVSSAVTAISSVISNFQFAHMETSLNAIEHNTRYTMEYVGERADGGILGILFRIDEELAWGAQTKAIENLRDLFLDWSNLVAPMFQAIQRQLEGLAPFVIDSATALQDIRTAAYDVEGVIKRGFDTLNITVTATGVTTAAAAKALGDQIAANLSRQLVPVT